ncbi:fluoride efflux transporter CrcB [Cohnella lubricantis]|uniref:Fluoride-specific ion channel FluC n=1 Tax=Cohnella lubricantis TaxID=2163172 RepID=A0A841T7Z9_9BACL|nr:fluoride efflux transporter CrcB [Cohnella lubricantis]MBB6676209.1 fluoride efflux transporter CrcB [Cohnella lubricantis]MBP2117236.1 CrcB protein [Cohnella lubricantis]
MNSWKGGVDLIYVYLGVGGTLGAISRYSLGIWIGERFGQAFPVHTLTINLLGCFLLSLFYTLTTTRYLVHPHFRSSFGTGFVGSFTTFSTFSYENVTLLQSAHYGLALLYIAASLLGGYLFTSLGIRLGNYEKGKIQQEGE